MWESRRREEVVPDRAIHLASPSNNAEQSQKKDYSVPLLNSEIIYKYESKEKGFLMHVMMINWLAPF